MEKNTDRGLLCGILPVLLAACSHYQLPVNHLETPESRGDGKIGRLEVLALSTSADLTEAPSVSSSPESGTTLEVQKGFLPSLGFMKGISDHLDIGVRFQPQAPLTYRIKYQLNGNPETSAKAGDLPVAISFSPGFLLGSYNGQSTTYFLGDLALLAGYRLSSENLLILTPFFTFASLSGIPLTATVAPGASSTHTTTTVGSATATQYGAAFGIQHSIEALFIRGEISYTRGAFEDSGISGFYIGTLMGFAL